MRFFNTLALGLASVMAVNAGKIYHCTEPNTIALTFDDGPYDYTAELLDQLKAAGIHATFFINGYNWWHDLETNKSKQAVVARAAKEGHQIASHTWRHAIPDTKPEIKENLDRLDDVIEKCTGYRPKYFRAPQGNCDEDCIAYIEGLGYKVIQWDTDTHDWSYKFDGVEDRGRRVKMVKKFLTEEWAKKKSNYLVLMHDVHVHTVKEIVPWITRHAPFDKYKFVTVAECLGDHSFGKNGKGSNSTKKSTTTKTKTITTARDIAATAPVSIETPAAGNAPVVVPPSGNVPVQGNAPAPGNVQAPGNVPVGTDDASKVAFVPTTTIPVYGTSTATPYLNNIVPGNSTANLQPNNNTEVKSGANSITYNFSIFAALLVYSLYMLL